MPSPFTFLLRPLLAIAAFGLVVSTVVHVAALVGIAPPGGKLVWMLHAGIFVVWLPAVLLIQQVMRFTGQKDLWKTVLGGCPAWMRRVVYASFAYAIINFALFAMSTAGHAQPHGDAPPAVLRGFSGHWMAGYSAGFGVLFSALKAPQLFRPKKCSRGHLSGPLTAYCPSCGEALEDGSKIL